MFLLVADVSPPNAVLQDSVPVLEHESFPWQPIMKNKLGT